MNVVDYLTTLGLLTLGRIAQGLSLRGRRQLGAFIGRRLMGLSKSRRAVTAENILRSLPDISIEQRNVVMQGSYENLGIVMVELLSTPSLSSSDITEIVEIPGFEQVLARHRAGLATIFLSAHYGNWEYLAMTAGIMLDAPVTIVVHPQSNAIADAKLNAYRSRFGNVIVPMGEAARPLIRTLTSGGTVAFLVDQYGQYDKDPWIEFFGRPTPTYEAPAALALKYNVPIFYAFAERLPDGRYHAPIHQLPMDDLANDPQGIVELTRRHVQVLEDAIRRRPELWSWQHRRWRDG